MRTVSKVESRPPATDTQRKGVLWKRNRVSHRDKHDRNDVQSSRPTWICWSWRLILAGMANPFA